MVWREIGHVTHYTDYADYFNDTYLLYLLYSTYLLYLLVCMHMYLRTCTILATLAVLSILISYSPHVPPRADGAFTPDEVTGIWIVGLAVKSGMHNWFQVPRVSCIREVDYLLRGDSDAGDRTPDFLKKANHRLTLNRFLAGATINLVFHAFAETKDPSIQLKLCYELHKPQPGSTGTLGLTHGKEIMFVPLRDFKNDTYHFATPPIQVPRRDHTFSYRIAVEKKVAWYNKPFSSDVSIFSVAKPYSMASHFTTMRELKVSSSMAANSIIHTFDFHVFDAKAKDSKVSLDEMRLPLRNHHVCLLYNDRISRTTGDRKLCFIHCWPAQPVDQHHTGEEDLCFDIGECVQPADWAP